MMLYGYIYSELARTATKLFYVETNIFETNASIYVRA